MKTEPKPKQDPEKNAVKKPAKQEKILPEEESDLIDVLMDEKNKENIILYDENNNEVEFEQVAVIPLNNQIYVILKDLTHPERSEDGEEDVVDIFSIEEDEEGESVLIALEDEKIAEEVLNAYFKLADEADKKAKKKK